MEIARHWRLKAQRYRLEGSICPTCGQFSFPPRPVCPHYIAQPTRIDTCELPAIPISPGIVDAHSLKGYTVN